MPTFDEPHGHATHRLHWLQAWYYGVMYPTNIPVPFPIEFIPIPETNYRKGREGKLPDAIVIHIAEGSKASTVSWFKNPASQVSSHFLVNRDGSITQFVNTSNTAYTNGRIDNPINELVLERLGNPNLWTLTIEHEGMATDDATPAQYETSAKLVKFLSAKWGVPLNRTHVFSHREVYAVKSCPGKINVDKIVQMARKLP